MIVFGLTGFASKWIVAKQQNKSHAESDPGFVLSGSEFDLGDSLRQKQQYAVTIDIANRGQDPIHILRFETDCGCTLILPERKELAPGEKTTAQATVDIGMNRGRFARKCAAIYQHRNEEASRRCEFRICGVINPEFDVDLTRVSFRRAVREQKVITFTAKESPLDVQVKGVSAKGISASRIDSSSHGQQQVAIEFHPDDYQGGQDRAKVFLQTGNSVQQDFTIDVVIQ